MTFLPSPYTHEQDDHVQAKDKGKSISGWLKLSI